MFEQLLELILANQIPEINLYKQQINDTQVKQLAEALKHNQSVTAIHLDYNQIGDIGGQFLFGALQTNQSITFLNLSHNQIGDAVMQALSEMLQVNRSITIIHLNNNQIGNAGMQFLIEALQTNQSLITLNLTGNQINNASIHTISLMLQTNKLNAPLPLAQILANQTPEINLYNRQINDTQVKQLAEALQHNQSVTAIHLDHNQISDAGGQFLIEVLKRNRSITYMNLNHNQLGNACGQFLIEALQTNQSITAIHLNNNRINDRDTINTIQSLLQRNKDQIRATRNQTILTILLLLRHASALEERRLLPEEWIAMQKNFLFLPADIWRLITHWFDFPSEQKGYRTSHEVAEFLSQKNIFIEFNQRLQTTGENFRLVETHGFRFGGSRFGFLTPRKIPTPQPIALMENEIELPVQERPKRENARSGRY